MKLVNSDNHSLTIQIKGYQFPNMGSQSDKYDANWLIVAVDVDIVNEHWRAESPCLLTWEVERLVEWLEEISNGNNVSSLSFIEPELEFHLLKDVSGEATGIRIYLEGNLQPVWIKTNIKLWKDVFYIDCDFSELKIKTIIYDLGEQLRQFPKR